MNKLKQALVKDYNNLYQKGFTSSWREQRFIRKIEISIMDFNNLRKYNKHKIGLLRQYLNERTSKELITNKELEEFLIESPVESPVESCKKVNIS